MFETHQKILIFFAVFGIATIILSTQVVHGEVLFSGEYATTNGEKLYFFVIDDIDDFPSLCDGAVKTCFLSFYNEDNTPINILFIKVESYQSV